MSTIAFLGLGNMGLPMAVNLEAAGHTVRGFDPGPGTADRAAGAHISTFPSAAEACTDADVVITMLPSGQHLLGAYAPDNGIIGTVPAGTLLIDCSTVDVADARAAHELAAAADLVSIDAPVSGGTGGAEAGTLTFMVGASPTALDAAQPFLDVMGGRVVHCGAEGNGQAAKACNNMVLAASMIATCEAFVLAESLGLSHEALYDVMSTSSGQSWSLTSYCPVPGPVPNAPSNRDYEGGFANLLMRKDLRLAAAAADAGNVDMALGRHALEIYSQMAEEFPTKDFSYVIEAIRAASGDNAS